MRNLLQCEMVQEIPTADYGRIVYERSTGKCYSKKKDALTLDKLVDMGLANKKFNDSTNLAYVLSDDFDYEKYHPSDISDLEKRYLTFEHHTEYTDDRDLLIYVYCNQTPTDEWNDWLIGRIKQHQFTYFVPTGLLKNLRTDELAINITDDNDFCYLLGDIMPNFKADKVVINNPNGCITAISNAFRTCNIGTLVFKDSNKCMGANMNGAFEWASINEIIGLNWCELTQLAYVFEGCKNLKTVSYGPNEADDTISLTYSPQAFNATYVKTFEPIIDLNTAINNSPNSTLYKFISTSQLENIKLKNFHNMIVYLDGALSPESSNYNFHFPNMSIDSFVYLVENLAESTETCEIHLSQQLQDKLLIDKEQYVYLNDLAKQKNCNIYGTDGVLFWA